MLNNCRICLKAETNLFNTSSVVNNTTYNEELFFCVPEIDWNCNKTPSFICNNCTRDLKIATTFRRLCLESEKARIIYIEELNNISNGQEDLLNDEEDLGEFSNRKPEELLLNDDNTYENKIDVEEDPKLSKNSVDSTSISIGRCVTRNKAIGAETNFEVRKSFNENINDIKPYVPNRRERTCKFCKCTFSKYSTLANHIRSLHTFEKCFKCELCGEGFTNSEILSRHKNRHTGERKYVCSYCGKKFFTNSDLNHHIQRHQNKRNYKCDICENKSFNTANSLRTHKLVVHTNPNEWKYLCPICGRKCVTQASLTVHMKRHSNEKDFSCHLCSKKFCTKSELRKHISSHSNMRLHKCEICNQEYKDKKVMERHLTKKHGIGNAKIVERVKKYVCDICPKKFIGKRQLEKHLRSHSGIRPFKCEICEQAFICSSYIKGHMRNKHSMSV